MANSDFQTGGTRSEILADIPSVEHVFTDRLGGCSAGPFESLNLGSHVDDKRSCVDENRGRIVQALGGGRRFVCVRQVHGEEIVEVRAQASRSIEADGIWTQDPQALLAILVADCVPILMADTQGKAVAVVHAGWRGTESGIAGKMVLRLEKAGIPKENLRIALGPAIGPDHFEVDGECLIRLQAKFPKCEDAFLWGTQGKAHVDLWALNLHVLQEVGIPRHQVDVIRHCTVCDERYFSYRRDGGITGRQAGIIALKPPA